MAAMERRECAANGDLLLGFRNHGDGIEHGEQLGVGKITIFSANYCPWHICCTSSTQSELTLKVLS